MQIGLWFACWVVLRDFVPSEQNNHLWCSGLLPCIDCRSCVVRVCIKSLPRWRLPPCIASPSKSLFHGFGTRRACLCCAASACCVLVGFFWQLFTARKGASLFILVLATLVGLLTPYCMYATQPHSTYNLQSSMCSQPSSSHGAFCWPPSPTRKGFHVYVCLLAAVEPLHDTCCLHLCVCVCVCVPLACMWAAFDVCSQAGEYWGHDRSRLTIQPAP